MAFLTRGLLALGFASVLGFAAHAESPEPRGGRRAAEESTRTRPGGEGDDDERRPRREPHAPARPVRSAEELMREERTLAIDWQGGGCAIDGHTRFVGRLLALQNTSDMMSLEVWGDSQEYVPFDRVIYYLRVPRVAYVTMFWIGPRHDVFVSFENLRVPADRDVSVNPDAVVVPPLGREEWVGVATLEPFDFPCSGDEQEHLDWIERTTRAPHGIGRWEVTSRPTRSPAKPHPAGRPRLSGQKRD